jgi:hypothetical protein
MVNTTGVSTAWPPARVAVRRTAACSTRSGRSRAARHWQDDDLRSPASGRRPGRPCPITSRSAALDIAVNGRPTDAPPRRHALGHARPNNSRPLAAVTDNVNQAKGDQDPATWMPPYSSAHGRYINEWVAVKLRWRLTVDSAEKSALTSWASNCPNVTITVTRAIWCPASVTAASAVHEVGRYGRPDRVRAGGPRQLTEVAQHLAGPDRIGGVGDRHREVGLVEPVEHPVHLLLVRRGLGFGVSGATTEAARRERNGIPVVETVQLAGIRGVGAGGGPGSAAGIDVGLDRVLVRRVGSVSVPVRVRVQRRRALLAGAIDVAEPVAVVRCVEEQVLVELVFSEAAEWGAAAVDPSKAIRGGEKSMMAPPPTRGVPNCMS